MRDKYHRFINITVNGKTFQSLFPVTVTGNSDWKVFTVTVVYVNLWFLSLIRLEI